MTDDTTARREIRDAACPLCNGLRDDITLVVDGDRVVEAVGACPRWAGLLGVGREFEAESPALEREPASPDDAIRRAAEVLAASRAPVVWGLVGMTVEAQRAAVAIADRIGAVVVIEGVGRMAFGVGPSMSRAFQRVGRVGATLGEVRDRADVVVSIGHSHLAGGCQDNAARLLGPGRFLPEGRRGRTVIAIGLPAEADAPPSDVDLRIPVPRKRMAAFLVMLRAAVNGLDLDADRVARGTGFGWRTILDLADRLKSARYGAVLFGEGYASPHWAEPLFALVRDLNKHTRFVLVGPRMREINEAGAEAVLTWQAGAGDEVDFGSGVPRPIPGDAGFPRESRDEFDAALYVGAVRRPSGFLVNREIPATIPLIVVSPWRPGFSLSERDDDPGLRPWARADVFIETAFPGLDEGGTIVRDDGVMLPLRPPFPGRRMAMVDVLRRIDACLKDMGR